MKMKILRNTIEFFASWGWNDFGLRTEIKIKLKFFYFCWNLIKSLLILFLNLMWFVDGNVIIVDLIWIVFAIVWRQMMMKINNWLFWKEDVLEDFVNLLYLYLGVSLVSFKTFTYMLTVNLLLLFLIFGWSWLYRPKLLPTKCPHFSFQEPNLNLKSIFHFNLTTTISLSTGIWNKFKLGHMRELARSFSFSKKESKSLKYMLIEKIWNEKWNV